MTRPHFSMLYLPMLMVVAALLILGLVSFFGLERELLPSLSVPIARVVCEYPAVPAAEIEELGTVDAPNLLQIPLEQFIEMRADWPADKDASIAIYCGSGVAKLSTWYIMSANRWPMEAISPAGTVTVPF